MKTRTTTRTTTIALIVIQLVVVAIHVGTEQVELIRILGNLVLGGWAFAMLFWKGHRAAGLVAIAAYLALNAWFLFQNGLTNPEMGDALRTPLFILVGLSAVLSWVVAARDTNSRSNPSANNT